MPAGPPPRRMFLVAMGFSLSGCQQVSLSAFQRVSEARLRCSLVGFCAVRWNPCSRALAPFLLQRAKWGTTGCPVRADSLAARVTAALFSPSS